MKEMILVNNEKELKSIFERDTDPFMCDNRIYTNRTFYNEVIDTYSDNNVINAIKNIDTNANTHNICIKDIFRSRVISLYNNTIRLYIYNLKDNYNDNVYFQFFNYDFDTDVLKLCDINTYLNHHVLSDVIIAFTSHILSKFEYCESFKSLDQFQYHKNQSNIISKNLLDLVTMFVNLVEKDALILAKALL